MGPALDHPPVRFQVRLDGAPPGAAHGLDTDANGAGTATYPRMYQLVRHQPGPVTDRLFEIDFLDPAIEAFVLTFG